MLQTEDILKLVEANMIMSSLIDRLFLMLLQYETIEEMERADIFGDMGKVAKIMIDYEGGVADD
jgi:hypothetical protein